MSSEKKFRIQNGLDVAGEVLVNGINIVGADGVLNQASYQTAVQAMIDATVAQGVDQNSIDTAVSNAVAALADSAPETLDTLNELAAALGDDADFATSMTNALNTKLTAANNLSDVADAAAARSNLGLGTAATAATTSFATAAQGVKADSAAQQTDLDNLAASINVGTRDFTVSGTITAGQPVTLLSTGEVTFVAAPSISEDTITTTTHSEVSGMPQFEGENNSQKFEYVSGNTYVTGGKVNNQAVLVLMTADSTSVSYETPVVVNSTAGTSPMALAYNTVSNIGVVLYKTGGNFDPIAMKSFTISGSTITLSSETVLSNSNRTMTTLDIMAMPDGSFFGTHIGWSNGGQGGTIFVVDSTGSISYSQQPAGWDSNATQAFVAYNPTYDKVYVAWQRGMVTGTSIACADWNSGSPNFDGNSETYSTAVPQGFEYNPVTDKLMICLLGIAGDPYQGMNSVGSVSTNGTVSVEHVMNKSVTDANVESPMFINAEGVVNVMHREHTVHGGQNGFGWVSFTDGTLGETSTFYSDPDVVSGDFRFKIGVNPNGGTAGHLYNTTDGGGIPNGNDWASAFTQMIIESVITPSPSNFVGISNASVTDTTAEIVIAGGLSTNHTGLSVGSSYYVQSDGSLSTVESGIKAGTALDATTILVSDHLSDSTDLSNYATKAYADSAVAGVDLTNYSNTAAMNTAISTAVSDISSSDLDMGGNKVLFGNVYSNLADLPDASTYHGMFAHVHATGKGYFAHAGNWVELANSSDLLTQSDIDTAVSNLVDSAPDALNTLNELAAALGDDANFASTVTTSLAAKADDAATTAALATKADLTYVDAQIAGIDVNAQVDLSDYSTTVQMNTAIDSAVSAVVDVAPDALNTLNELSAALGDDANFATTMTNALATKADSTALDAAVADIATNTTALAAKADANAVATLAQGALADTALQPADLGTGFGTNTTSAYDWTVPSMSAHDFNNADFQAVLDAGAVLPSFAANNNKSTHNGSFAVSAFKSALAPSNDPSNWGNTSHTKGSFEGLVIVYNDSGHIIDWIPNPESSAPTSNWGSKIAINPNESDSTLVVAREGSWGQYSKLYVYTLDSYGATYQTNFTIDSRSHTNGGYGTPQSIAVDDNYIYVGYGYYRTSSTDNTGAVQVFDHSGSLIRSIVKSVNNKNFGDFIFTDPTAGKVYVLESTLSDFAVGYSPVLYRFDSGMTTEETTFSLGDDYIWNYPSNTQAFVNGKYYFTNRDGNGTANTYHSVEEFDVNTGTFTNSYNLPSGLRSKNTNFGAKILLDENTNTLVVYEEGQDDSSGTYGQSDFRINGKTLHFFDTTDGSYIGEIPQEAKQAALDDGVVFGAADAGAAIFDTNLFGAAVFVDGAIVVTRTQVRGNMLASFNVTASLNTTTSYIVDDSVFATKAYVDSGVAGVDLSAYSTTAEMNTAIAAVDVTGSDLDMGGNKVLFGNVYSTLADLPSATTYHGMFAHVHATGKGYFAHAGNWVELANSSDLVTQSDIDTAVTTAVADVVDAAPDSLNTLNELAAALGDDANFASTVTTSLASKADSATVTASLADKADITYVNTQIAGIDVNAQVDLTDYSTTVEMNTAIANAVSAGTVDLSSYSTTAQMNTAISTAVSGVDLSNYSTTTQMNTAISTAVDGLVDSAPGALDTLNELAAALGDDANFASTVTTSLAAKADANAVATAAQGALADTALQPADLTTGFASATVTTPDFSSATGTYSSVSTVLDTPALGAQAFQNGNMASNATHFGVWFPNNGSRKFQLLTHDGTLVGSVDLSNDVKVVMNDTYVAINDEILGSNPRSGTVKVYDMTMTLVNSFTAVNWGARRPMAFYGSDIIAVGGTNPSNYYDEVKVYNWQTGSLLTTLSVTSGTDLSGMPGVELGGMSVSGDKLFVGNWRGSNQYRKGSVDVFDMTDYSKLATISNPEARYGEEDFGFHLKSNDDYLVVWRRQRLGTSGSSGFGSSGGALEVFSTSDYSHLGTVAPYSSGIQNYSFGGYHQNAMQYFDFAEGNYLVTSESRYATSGNTVFIINLADLTDIQEIQPGYSSYNSPQVFVEGSEIFLSYAWDSNHFSGQYEKFIVKITATNGSTATSFTVDGSSLSVDDADKLDGQHGTHYRINIYDVNGTLVN